MSLKGADILRFIDTIHRDRNIEKAIIFDSLENALFSAARKKLGGGNDVFIEIDRKTGDITAFDGEDAIDPLMLGRIAALTFKQVMIQKFREAERDVTYDEYFEKQGTLITGTIQRNERPTLIVNLGRSEGIVPWREQVPTENYNAGDRIKCLVLEVKKVGQQVRIVLSRSSPDLLRHLFELEVPEIASCVIEIRELVRDAGHRSKVAVQSLDHNVDCVGACVGIRGSRIKNIVDELNGEKIDIVRWNESPDLFIHNAMKPAEIDSIELDFDTKKARLLVKEDQLSLAIGRRGQNVRLASALTGWELDLVTEAKLAEIGAAEQTTISPESKLDAILSGQTTQNNSEISGHPSAVSKLDAIMSTPTTSVAAEESRSDQRQQDDAETSSLNSGPSGDTEQ